jgi:cell division protein FtsQ
MDGERRVAEPLTRNRFFRPDCSAFYRVAARCFALLFLTATIVRGVVLGGHLEYPGSPWQKLPGELAGMFGLAAMDIELAGLSHHDPQEVLGYIGVKPGSPLIGFDAKKARAKLQELDWVETATVVRRFPNQLQITVTEREPFVVWQMNGQMHVVDQNGKPMTGIAASAGNLLLHVVGLGANTEAASLVNQMEATPGLFQEVKAAVRVGDRRWDLHMNNGVIIALPEINTSVALKQAETAFLSGDLKLSPLAIMDYRVAGETAFRVKTTIELPQADPTTTSSIQ